MNTLSVAIHDAAYPRRLASIPKAPPALYARGSMPPASWPSRLDAHAVAIVGTREATYAGLDAANRIASAAARAGFVVVSGLALGIDGAAHRGCLDAHGVTVAVMAHGLDTVYPREHRDLAARIVACGGMLVSEWPDGTQAAPWRFATRNRIQSGLSGCVVVVECGPESGTMHTARYAHEQGRPVIAVQSRAEDPALRNSGGAEIVKTIGATPAHSVAEVMASISAAMKRAKAPTTEEHQ